MMITPVSGSNAPVSGSNGNVIAAGTRTGYAALGQADFLKLMTTQLQQQDPTSPVDGKEMLAQLAQFQSLGGINDVNQTLQSIAAKLDAVLASQAAAKTST
jgi:flagellar basal-body rod modification protein FlgD